MIKRFLVGGITLFTWEFVSWVVLTWHFDTVFHDIEVTAVVENIEDLLPESGVYYFPPLSIDHLDDETREAYIELHRNGPSGMTFYNSEHRDPMSNLQLLLGFFSDVTSAVFATLLLIVALPSLPPYWDRVTFVTTLGVFAVLLVRMMDGTFHYLPIQWTINTSLN